MQMRQVAVAAAAAHEAALCKASPNATVYTNKAARAQPEPAHLPPTQGAVTSEAGMVPASNAAGCVRAEAIVPMQAAAAVGDAVASSCRHEKHASVDAGVASPLPPASRAAKRAKLDAEGGGAGAAADTPCHQPAPPASQPTGVDLGSDALSGATIQPASRQQQLQPLPPLEAGAAATGGSKTGPSTPLPGEAATRQVVQQAVERFVSVTVLEPLQQEGVIDAQEHAAVLQRAVAKVMQHHADAYNPDFLIRETEKIKRLATALLEHHRAAMQR